MKTKRQNIAKATGVVSFFTLISRVLGLVRDMAIASFFGAAMSADAFFVAFKIPNLLRRLVAEGSLSTAFVPVFSDELEKSKEDAQKAFSASLSFCLLLTCALAILGIIFAEPITHLFSPGFSENPEKMELTISLTRIMLPYIILVSILALLSSVLNCLGFFALPAAAPAILNISMIAFLAFLAPDLEKPIYALSYAVLTGGVLALIPQAIKLIKVGYKLRLASAFHSPAVRKLVFLMLPSILSASIYQLMIFINTILASLLKEGSVSWLYYADRLFQFPLGVFTIALATAILPTLAKEASKENQKEVNKQASKALNLVSFICLPAATGLFILAPEIIGLFYMRGAFDAESAYQTSLALKAFSIGLWGISCNSILVRVFLSKKNTKIPAYISAFTLVINMVFSLMLMGPAESMPSSSFGVFFSSILEVFQLSDLDHVGLALAGSLASTLSALFLYLLLGRIETSISLSAFVACTLKSVVASLVMGLSLLQLQSYELSNLLVILIAVPMGALIYFLMSLILKVRELEDLKGMLR